MAKTIIVAGYGPGISTAVAEKFGAEGFQVALVARNVERLDAGVKALEAKGIKAAAFTANLGSPEEVTSMVQKVRSTLGSITVLEWTAYSPGNVAADITKATSAELRSLFDVGIVGLVAAVQAVLPDLKQATDPALLITNGGAGYTDPGVDAAMVEYGLMGLGLANAAKHKLVGLLAAKLESDRIYVGEIMVAGTIKNSSFDHGNANLDGSTVAAKFWDMYTARTDVRAKVG
jgi:NAD(P)-dependent dehydrogenase (short-subunit alcohol dehydrogenase family)